METVGKTVDMKKFVIQQQIVNFGGTSVIKEPWPHLLVDDFFTPGEFKFLQEESKKMVEDIQPDEKIILQDFWKWKRKRLFWKIVFKKCLFAISGGF